MIPEMVHIVCNEVPKFVKGKDFSNARPRANGGNNPGIICSAISFNIGVSWLNCDGLALAI